ncbi:MAG: hypothetical protein IJU56_09750 [Clostridia bacterium]|nr:hypothetical protein [Clostridia bacterium]
MASTRLNFGCTVKPPVDDFSPRKEKEIQIKNSTNPVSLQGKTPKNMKFNELFTVSTHENESRQRKKSAMKLHDGSSKEI